MALLLLNLTFSTKTLNLKLTVNKINSTLVDQVHRHDSKFSTLIYRQPVMDLIFIILGLELINSLP